MSEDIINEILNNPTLLDKITSVISERIKNDIILQRLTKLEESVVTLAKVVQENNQQIASVWKKLGDIENEIGKIYRLLEEHSKRIEELAKRVEEHSKILEEHSKRIEELTKRVEEHSRILEEHSKRIEELTRRVEELAKRIEEHSKILEEHSKRIEELAKRVEEHSKILEEHSKRIEELTKRVEEHSRILEEHSKRIEELTRRVEELAKRIEEHSKILEEHSKRIEELTKAFLKLKVSFESFTSRAGIHVQRTLMELYKEALKLHGVDPSSVKHGYIVDEVGVIEKGRKFEVDFYETNDEIRLFEVKNLGDTDGIEQLIVRKKILESKGTKKQIKMYLVCNSIPKKVLLKAKKEGIIVIAGDVLGERKRLNY
ncbi:hypothetical protein GFS03_04340 [Sulfolobus sp. E5-1-F]|uniref:hypothetical protein n=1 Tax=Saccharolobus sp. E5-1-F TaxID=2663019 RepID=UPI001296D4EA|nr:hypothetical protein [Sulfolobus sp. E5-1-F]QGA53860.1 hypothetical protein GFS03_04340 [Sulfolobus sp. E5-1-F]